MRFLREAAGENDTKSSRLAEVNARLVWTDLQSKGLVSIERSVVAALLSRHHDRELACLRMILHCFIVQENVFVAGKR